MQRNGTTELVSAINSPRLKTPKKRRGPFVLGSDPLNNTVRVFIIQPPIQPTLTWNWRENLGAVLSTADAVFLHKFSCATQEEKISKRVTRSTAKLGMTGLLSPFRKVSVCQIAFPSHGFSP